MFTYSDYVESAAVLREKLSGFKPDVLIILGSGLGSLGENVQNPIFIDYGRFRACGQAPQSVIKGASLRVCSAASVCF